MSAVQSAHGVSTYRTSVVERTSNGHGWILAGPAALLLGAFVVLPTVAVMLLSLLDVDLAGRAVRFVGVDNFVELLRDPLFWASLSNTLLYMVVVVPVTLALGLMLAMTIEADPAMRSVYRSVHLLPVFAAFPAVAMAWEILLHPTIGPFNEALRSLGIAPKNWFRDRDVVLPTLMVIGVWQHLGIVVVLFIGALKGIPRDLYDAAELDGAKLAADRFLTVTMPGLGPVAVFVTMLIAMKALEVFDTPRVLTQGGPGFASETLLHTLFVESFVYLRTGFGAALTVVFLCLAIVLTMLRRSLDRRVHYT